MKRIADVYPNTLLLVMCFYYASEGLNVVRVMALKMILKDDFSVNEDDVKSMLKFALMPWTFKAIFGLVIDFKFLKWRKIYLALFGILATLAQTYIVILHGHNNVSKGKNHKES